MHGRYDEGHMYARPIEWNMRIVLGGFVVLCCALVAAIWMGVLTPQLVLPLRGVFSVLAIVAVLVIVKYGGEWRRRQFALNCLTENQMPKISPVGCKPP